MGMLVSPYRNAVAGGGGYGSHRYWRIAISANNGDASNTQICEMEFRGSVGGSDLTGSGTVLSGGSGSDGLGNEAAKAFDNNTTTTWVRTSATNTWIGYDFGSATTVAEVMIRAYTAPGTEYSRAPKNFTLDYSDDGSSWTTADTFTAYGWVATQERVYPETAPAAGYHRFWRLFVTSTTGGTQTQIVELEFRATSGGADQTSVQTSNSGSSTGRIVVSGEGAGNEGYRAYDGTLTTSTGWFQSSGANTYNAYVFPNPVTVAEVTVLGSSSTNRSPSALKIEYSDDGTTWTAAKTSTGLSWTAGETKTFSVP